MQLSANAKKTARLRGQFYFLRFGLCVRAEAAAVLAAFDERGLRRTFDAADAARALVTSLFFFFTTILTSFLSFY